MGPLAPWARREVRAYDDDRARNWVIFCVIVSMLLHIGFFVIPWPKHTLDMTPPPAAAARGPVSVHLETRRSHATPDQEQEIRRKPVPPPPQKSVVTSRRPPSPDRPTAPPPPLNPQPTVKPAPVTPPEPDMIADLKKHRAERGESDPSPNAQETSGGGGNTDNDVALNNIKRALSMNSRTVGTGGVFQVLSMGVREATLRFNGWHPGSDNRWHETYTVDAGDGGNVQLAVVRKEIEIIRKFYTGDFDWISSRSGGRVIHMSARPADNEQLERFLMHEMWDDDPDGPRRHG
jgi:hypothetical protein